MYAAAEGYSLHQLRAKAHLVYILEHATLSSLPKYNALYSDPRTRLRLRLRLATLHDQACDYSSTQVCPPVPSVQSFTCSQIATTRGGGGGGGRHSLVT